MATETECRTALERLAGQLAGSAGQGRAELDRSLSCHVPDLDLTFTGHLRGGRAQDLTTEPAGKAQIRFTVASDDLVDIADGRLPFGAAFTSGRLKVQASVFDLLKLKSLI
ncbi:MAG: SCP2 sterol-binding domain-containing protein [Actinomycetota bacterium]|nr:SCP2 sterol-binding domain-containing protein [Actinomycetota bacterium]